MDYYLDAFRQAFDFSGRSTRKAYWMFVLINLVISLLLMGVEVVINAWGISALYNLVLIVPGISYAVRRLHDTGRSGWWLLLFLVPVIGIIIVMILLALESDGPNQYDSEEAEEGVQEES